MIFDTHCHPHLNTIKKTPDIIGEFFRDNGTYMNVIGTDPNTNKQVLELANTYPGVYASIGIHPCDIQDLDFQETMNILKQQYQDNSHKVVAIGETGLDYHWPVKDAQKLFGDNISLQEKYINEIKQLQKIFFRAHILLAQELDLPIIIHNRDSKDDVLEILEQNNCKNFIFHCYSEDLPYAKKLLRFAPNCKISFSGIVTFKNAKDIQETAKTIPLKNIICETDSPYLTPTPHRGKQENEPLFTKYIIEYICELRNEDPQKIQKQIFQNSCDVFGIK